MKIVHIITGLATGGAETMLYKLLASTDTKTYKVEVISLTSLGDIGAKIMQLGIPVRALGMRRGVPGPMSLLKLSKWLQLARPDVIQTWMYHADLLGGLAAKLSGVVPVIWGIRQSNLHPSSSKKTTLLTVKICAFLSQWLPNKILCCSETARDVHMALGYRADKMVVIANGFDLAVFKPDATAKVAVRKELGVDRKTLLIGLVARFDAQKDHQSFIRAAGILHAELPEVHFVLCGADVDSKNSQLVAWITAAGCSENFHLLGNRQDIPQLTAALDIAVSASAYGEGFPNVLGEAMACAIPCVATDVGDSAFIIGATGTVVAVQDSAALALAWRDLLTLSDQDRQRLGESARRRIADNFNLPDIVERYQNLYQEVN